MKYSFIVVITDTKGNKITSNLAHDYYYQAEEEIKELRKIYSEDTKFEVKQVG